MKLLKFAFVIAAAISLQACSEEERYNMDTPSNSDVELSGAVDLGLSVKWAACDLGSTLPYVDGKTYSGELLYINGMEDISGTEYDPATKELGSGWRTPTKQEIAELIADCSWTQGAFHNVQGYYVKGPSGKVVFFPEGEKWSATKDQASYPQMRIFGLTYNYHDPVLESITAASSLGIRPVKDN